MLTTPRKPRKITPEVMAGIAKAYAANETYGDMSVAFNLSKQTITRAVERLIKDGTVERRDLIRGGNFRASKWSDEEMTRAFELYHVNEVKAASDLLNAEFGNDRNALSINFLMGEIRKGSTAKGRRMRGVLGLDTDNPCSPPNPKNRRPFTKGFVNPTSRLRLDQSATQASDERVAAFGDRWRAVTIDMLADLELKLREAALDEFAPFSREATLATSDVNSNLTRVVSALRAGMHDRNKA